MPAWLRAHPGAWGLLVLVLGALIALWWLGTGDVQFPPAGPITVTPTVTPAAGSTAVAQDTSPLLPTATFHPRPPSRWCPPSRRCPPRPVRPVPPTDTPSPTPTVVLLTPPARAALRPVPRR